jgi:hypothetical protein
LVEGTVKLSWKDNAINILSFVPGDLRAVSEAMGRMYDGLYQRLGTKEQEKDIYRMVKSRERKTRYIIQVKCINDETE